MPKARPGEEFAYYFQYAIFVKEKENTKILLDTYEYEALYPPIYTNLDTYASMEDLVRVYAPYLTYHKEGDELVVVLENPAAPPMFRKKMVRMESWA